MLKKGGERCSTGAVVDVSRKLEKKEGGEEKRGKGEKVSILTKSSHLRESTP